jgi:hypothetical protein
MDLVSAVIPAFNAAATLDRTIASVRSQDWPALEIVVVDDGSTDDTAAIGRRHAAEDPRVRLVRQANRGLAGARNAGIREARGAFIAPVDADDLWHPTKVARQMRRMAEIGPSCGMVYTLSRWIDAEDRVFADTGVPGFEGRAHLRTMVVNPVRNGSALLLRRAAIDQAGGYPEELHRDGLRGCEDYYLQSAVAQRWAIGVVPLWLTGYRKSRAGMSGDYRRMKRSLIAAVRLLVARFPETTRTAAAAAEAVAYGESAVVSMREWRLLEALDHLARGVGRSPLVALDTVFVEEAPRLVRAAARRVAALWRRPTPGPRFYDLDPSAPFEPGRRLPLAWLLARLAQEERRAEPRPPSLTGPTAARA